MNEVTQSSPFDAIRQYDDHGEFWRARDLMPLLGYRRWQKFVPAIERAIVSAKVANSDVDMEFFQLTEVIRSGNLTGQMRVNYRLTRHACYLIAMNGDVRKPEIAAAQAYFTIKTREAEIAPAPARMPSHPEALRGWAESIEREEILKRQVEANVAEIEKRNERLAITGPKADAWDALASADRDFSVGDAAKMLASRLGIKIGQNRLFDKLEELGWIYRLTGNWHPYQTAIEGHWLATRARDYQHPREDRRVLAIPQIRITIEGMNRLRKLLTSPPPTLPGLRALGAR